MHKLRDIRTKEIHLFSDEELRDFIIKKTKCQYEDKAVLSERTGMRYNQLKSMVKEVSLKYHLVSNLFIVTAVGRVNSDKKTRYLLISNGAIDESILEMVNPCVPIFVFEKPEGESDEYASYISKWFRGTMGRAFSFIDIDYLIFDKSTDLALLIEEKDSQFVKMGYGQEISYAEMLEDVLTVDAQLLVINTSNISRMYINFYQRSKAQKYRLNRLYNLCSFYTQIELKSYVENYFKK